LAPETHDLLVFELGGKRYGLPGSDVRELLRAVAVDPVPRGPPFMEGVINVRGTVVPVLDLRQWLGLPGRPIVPSDHFVVVALNDRLAAIRVDRALDLTKLETGTLEPGTDPRTRVVKLADGLLVVPDLTDLLTDENLRFS
jgi:purine-binding chemotaxis protein CheW